MASSKNRVVEVILKAKDTTANVIGRFRRNMRAVQKVVTDVTRVVATSTAAIGAMVLGLTKLAEQGEKVNAVKRAFNRITTDQIDGLRKLRDASAGTVSDMELMSRHNQALTLGAADTTEQFAELVRISRALGRAQGIDATQALESLTTGLGRQSKLFLDNLGILVDTEGAYERYAKSLGKTSAQLTDNEKRTAFMAEAMEQARRKAAELSDGNDAAGSSAARLSTAFVNLRDRLASFTAESPEIAAFFDGFAGILDNLAEVVASGDMTLLKDAFREIGTIAGNAFSLGVTGAVKASGNFLDQMVNALVPERFRVTDEERARFDAMMESGDAPRPWIDRLTDALEESGELARENIEVASAALGEIAQAARDAIAERGGGGAGPGPSRSEPDPTVDVPFARMRTPSLFSPEAIAAFNERRGRVNRARLGPAVLMPGSLGMGPGLTNAFSQLSPEQQAAISGLNEGTKAFGDAAQVVTAGMFSAAEAMVRGSDQIEASIINMVTNILRSIPSVGGGFLGTLIGGVGGLLSAAFSRSRDPVPVRMAEIDDRAAEKLREAGGGPDRITLTVERGGVEVERIERDLRDRQNRDEVIRYSPRSGDPLLGSV